MPYKFRIGHVNIRRVGGNITGATICIICEDTDTGITSELGWFVAKADFPSWPPTKPQMKQYIKSYLKAKPAGSDLTRIAAMKARAVVINDEPDVAFVGEIEDSLGADHG